MADNSEDAELVLDGASAAAPPPGSTTDRLRAEALTGLSAGSGAVIAAVASLMTCYSGIVGASILGMPDLGLNPHVQAVLMWGLAIVAVWFLLRDRRQHDRQLPLVLGGLAVVTLIVTLYVGYDQQIEAGAYVLLVIATFLNQTLLLKSMHETVRRQTAVIGRLNDRLAEKVVLQEEKIGRLARLKHFLAPQIADLVLKDEGQHLLRSHRRYIACLFCDLRNFTALSEEAEPEELIEVLERFHDRAGARVAARGGTIGFRAGDGLMVFFNDPVPCKEPVFEAIQTAFEIRQSFRDIQEPWRRRGQHVGIGIGIASGFATLGLVGLQGRTDYTAIGSVVNAAARICDTAEDGQILLSQRAHVDVEGQVEIDALPAVSLKGFARPMEIVSVRSVIGLAES